nr:transposase [Deltaproteobacteria bacterium]
MRKELEGYLECGLLCHGFARLKCGSCDETRLVAFSCKGRGFCPSCLGRKMSATAAHLIEDVLPPVDLRQWVLTVPFAWRKRLGYDGRLMSALTRIFVKTVLAFYRERGGGPPRGQSGAVVAVYPFGYHEARQRTSSDLKLNPHVHAVFLDGAAYRDKGDELDFRAVGHLSTRDVAAVLERTRDRMVKYLRRRGLLLEECEADGDGDGRAVLAASAVSGTTPPAGPEWRRGALPFERRPMVFERPLCVALDGFTLHAATRAGGHDEAGREALLKYILRPSVAQERVTRGPDGLVRITLKKPFSDGTVAVDLDPLSLLSRLAASVPAPRLHTVRYAGVLASASKLRPRLAPKPVVAPAKPTADVAESPRRGAYRPWAELLKRTFGFDVLTCPCCSGRMKLLALVTEPTSVARYLRGIGEPTDVPKRTPARGPPYWASRVLRRGAGSVEAAE